MSQTFSKLVHHLAWADEAVLAALRQTPSPGPQWVELMAHVLGAEHTWLTRLQAVPPRFAVWPQLTVEECASLARENRETLLALVAQLPDDALQRIVHYRNSAGQEFDSTVEDILLQVFLHGCYHRGQIALAMRQGGAVPAPTDYIGYVRGSPAATRQSGR